MLGVYTGAGTTLGSPFKSGDAPDTPSRCSRSRTAFTHASNWALRGILQRAVLTLRAEGVLIGVGVACIVARVIAWRCASRSLPCFTIASRIRRLCSPLAVNASANVKTRGASGDSSRSDMTGFVHSLRSSSPRLALSQ